MEKKGDNDLEEIIKTLKDRIKDLEVINETHRIMNGDLRSQIQSLESESTKDKNLLQGYKKVIEDLSKRMIKK
jgi:hypothetical protein|tara:strand:- start:536 stop:754 length:219 start_codon:yes stop_codon:yes gene_type:complete